MKMTMKNELTLKHGVILAAAVLLITGIAFAGAAAAEATHITWSDANIPSTGGNFIVDVPSGHISGIGSKYFTDNLTLDFNYQTVIIDSLAGSTGKGGLFGETGANLGKNITIKNLIIDSSSLSTTVNTVAFIIGIAYTNSTVTYGNINLENILVKNSTISGIERVAGFVGGINSQGVKFVNCSIENSSITGTGVSIGGMVGSSTTNGAAIFNDCHVKNVYICENSAKGSGVSGFVGFSGSEGCTVISDCSIENSVIKGTTVNGLAGVYCGEVMSNGRLGVGSTAIERESIGAPISNSLTIERCTANNCIVRGYYSGSVGGITSTSVINPSFTANDNAISSSTFVSDISSDGCAGGFAGKLRTAAIASISNNTIANCCVVATSGDAAGFCPAVV